MVLVYKQKFTDEQMELLILNDETTSIDGQHYVCMPCRRTIKKVSVRHVMKVNINS